MGETRPLRERLRQRTAEEIEEAAFALFGERGYEATTIDQIAAAAGVSTRTFFRYFPSKEAVVFGDHQRAVQRLRMALAATDPSLPNVERVRRAMLAVERPGGGDDRRRRQAALAGEVPVVRAHHSRLIEDYEDAIAEVLASSPDAGPDALLRARLTAGAIFGSLRAAQRVSHNDPAVGGHQLFEAVFDLLGGMRSSQERERPAAAGDPDRGPAHS